MMGGGFEDSGETARAKRPRLPLPNVGMALSQDQLDQMLDLVSPIVGEYIDNFLADSSGSLGDVAMVFLGQSPDFIEEELFSGSPFVLGTADMTDEESADDFSDELLVEDSDEEVVEESDDEEERLEDPEEYVRQLAEELCDEILDEIVDEDLCGWQDEVERTEILGMPEIELVKEKIRAAVYAATFEKLEEISELTTSQDA
jgi:hypothetical protein